MKKSTGPLARFSKAYPYREVFVSQDLTEAVVCSLRNGDKIAFYTRARDARRQLRVLGYTQEGIIWRIVPKKEQPVPVCVAVELEHEHDVEH